MVSLEFPRLKDGVWRLLKKFMGFYRLLRGVERHSLAVLPYPDLRNSIISLILGARTRLGFSISGSGFLLTHCLPSQTGLVKRGEWMSNIAYALGLEPRWEPIHVPASVKKHIRQRFSLPQNFVSIHPGARHPTRQMPLDILENTCRKLRSLGINVVVIVPPDWENAGHVEDVIQIPTQSPEDLVYLLFVSTVAVCMDSGPMHLAHALGTPTVGIFTQNIPERVAPTGPTPFIAVEPSQSLQCRPCAKPYCKSWACGNSLKYEDIVKAVLSLLKGNTEVSDE
ncbi:MAG: hypothetical protein DRP82_04675 [Planctomycetota bacterium]|nr:MAG: hypothetical protein DRP82_04675 [Planctomycetota bacterium]